MKAIMISIKPKWVAKILNGEKTIEIRKTVPKCDLPIDVYIYCTKDNSDGYLYYSFGKTIFHDKYVLIKEYDKRCIIGNGKVVAKFTLNKVEKIRSYLEPEQWYMTSDLGGSGLLRRSCLTFKELDDYLLSGEGYAIHISDLEIFDRPKELSEFKKNNSTGNCWKCKLFGSGCSTCQLTKAPQNFCYVEVE